MIEAQPFSPARIITLLQASTDAVVGEVRALGPLARQAPRAGEWCANEVLGHLIEADQRGFAGRIRLTLDQERPIYTPWDQPSVAAARHDDERDPEDLIASFLAGREVDLRMVSGLGGAHLARCGQHPHVGELSVSDLLHEWVHHDREHLAQLLDISRSFVWPAMGNARRFAELDV